MKIKGLHYYFENKIPEISILQLGVDISLKVTKVIILRLYSYITIIAFLIKDELLLQDKKVI